MRKPTRAAKALPKLFEDIREVVYRHDPSGHFALGAPKDEHDASINRIISSLQFVHGLDDVEEVLQVTLRGWILYNGGDPAEVCTAMAPAIWGAWHEFRLKAG